MRGVQRGVGCLEFDAAHSAGAIHRSFARQS